MIDNSTASQAATSKIAGGWYGEITVRFRDGNGMLATLTFKFDVIPVPELVRVVIERHGGFSKIERRDLVNLPLGQLQSLFLDYLHSLYPEDFESETSGLGSLVPETVKLEWPKGDKKQVFHYVEKVYNDAISRRLPPTAAVVEAFGVTRGVASRMIAQAREGGYQLADPVSYSGRSTRKGQQSSGTATVKDRRARQRKDEAD